MKKEDNWLKEFTEFSEVRPESVKVPDSLFQSLQKRLFPNPWKVFAKIVGLYGVVGFFSLALCNQFGLNPFQTNFSLSDYFMKMAGHNVCMVFCGVIFVSLPILFSNLVLNFEELESVRRYEWLQLGVLSFASIGAFYFFGAELVGTFVGLWLLGALIGGFVSVEGSYFMRRQFA
jgi:hypothetical protein